MTAARGDLDPVIHTQARLRIMTTLTALPLGDRITFPRLQGLLDATAGNLSTHLRRLEDAGYVAVTKGHIGRVPATHVEATRAGRRAFEDYVAQLGALLTPPPGTTGTTPHDPAAPDDPADHDTAVHLPVSHDPAPRSPASRNSVPGTPAASVPSRTVPEETR